MFFETLPVLEAILYFFLGVFLKFQFSVEPIHSECFIRWFSMLLHYLWHAWTSRLCVSLCVCMCSVCRSALNTDFSSFLGFFLKYFSALFSRMDFRRFILCVWVSMWVCVLLVGVCIYYFWNTDDETKSSNTTLSLEKKFKNETEKFRREMESKRKANCNFVFFFQK